MSDPMEVEPRYQMIREIGGGSFGVVCQMRDTSTNQMVAVKRLYYPGDEDGLNSDVVREVSNLKKLAGCPQVVDLINHTIQYDHLGKCAVTLIFEFMESDLDKFIQRYNPVNRIPASIVKILMFQLCKGVYVCHRQGILHRDLKPDNLLINNSSSIPQLKLGDLGLSRSYNDYVVRQHSRPLVFVNYRGPEIYLGELNLSRGTDIWSIGCIFAELVTTKKLFPGPETDVMPQIFRLLGAPNEAIWRGVTSLPSWPKYTYLQNYPVGDLTQEVPGLEPAGINLLQRMLQYDPKTRISAKSALEHPYFNDVDKRRY